MSKNLFVHWEIFLISILNRDIKTCVSHLKLSSPTLVLGYNPAGFVFSFILTVFLISFYLA